MSSDALPASAGSKGGRRRLRSAYTNVAAQGEPWVWLTGGALATALAMITGLLCFILFRGASTFWPQPLELVELVEGPRRSAKSRAGNSLRRGRGGSCGRKISN